jgi:hypothetical protein
VVRCSLTNLLSSPPFLPYAPAAIAKTGLIVDAAQVDNVLEQFVITVLQPGNDENLFRANAVTK